MSIRRLHRQCWILFLFDIENWTIPRSSHDMAIRIARPRDIEYIKNHEEGKEGQVSSVLRFWNEHGFRSLHLGFRKGDSAPCVFQYVLDDTDNHRYKKMQYGRMYRPQNKDTVQVENLYAFRKNRRANVAYDFEAELFRLLRQQGKRIVRTHISAANIPALGWAKKIGFKPDSWLVGYFIDLPVLRSMRIPFVFADLKDKDYETYPLSLFRSWQA